MANPFDDLVTQRAPQGGVVRRPLDPYKPAAERRAEEDQALQRAADARAAEALRLSQQGQGLQSEGQQFQQSNTRFDNVAQQRDKFNNLQAVKDYKAVLPLLMSGLQTAPNAQGDSALIYSYAKVMDPGSVVRESEGQMASNTASFWDAKTEQLKKALGFDNSRGLPARAAAGLRDEMNRKVAQLAKAYGSERLNFQEFAKQNGLPAEQIVGRSPAEPYKEKYLQLVPGANQDAARDAVPDFSRAGSGLTDRGDPTLSADAPFSTEDDKRVAAAMNAAFRGGVSVEDLDYLHRNLTRTEQNPQGTPLDDARKAEIQKRARGSDAFVPATSGVAGAMQDMVTGAATTPGALGDIASGALAYGNAALGGIPGAITGGESMDALRSESPWATLGGELGGGVTGTLATGSILKGLGGLAGVAPRVSSLLSNPVAADTAYGALYGGTSADDPLLGAIIGGGTGLGVGGAANRMATNSARRTAEDEAMALIPSTQDLKDQAGALYSGAENSGALLDPMQTQGLSTDIAALLTREGVLSPSGIISDQHPGIKQTMTLANDYAGQTMNPVQMQTIRKSAADAAGSADASQARVGRGTRDIIDALVDPAVPDLPRARDVSSRYLQAQELEKARELAGARAGQFTGSGFENALRTEYRGLDRGIVKGQDFFEPSVVDAIKDVGRGTPGSNLARGLGRMAPTGVVSGGFGLGVGGLGTALGGPAVGIPLALATMGGGALARKVATNMTDRNAQLAEALARNGGPLNLNMEVSDIPALLAGGATTLPPWLYDVLTEEGQQP